MTNDAFKEKVQRVGLEIHALNEAAEYVAFETDALLYEGPGAIFKVLQMYDAVSSLMWPRVIDLVRGVDLVMGSRFAFAAHLACTMHKVPFSAIALAPAHTSDGIDQQSPLVKRLLNVWERGFGFGVDGFYSHGLHQPRHSFTVDAVTLRIEPRAHSSGTVKGRFQILIVDESHQVQIQRRLRHRLVIQRRAVDACELALSDDAEFAVWVYPSLPFLSRGVQCFFKPVELYLKLPNLLVQACHQSFIRPAVARLGLRKQSRQLLQRLPLPI